VPKIHKPTASIEKDLGAISHLPLLLRHFVSGIVFAGCIILRNHLGIARAYLRVIQQNAPMPNRNLANRPLTVPSEKRMPLTTPKREERLAAHEAAMSAGLDGYNDPVNNMFVMTAKSLADKGFCCDSGCRHCPYED
jgi:hypothetical protein